MLRTCLPPRLLASAEGSVFLRSGARVSYGVHKHQAIRLQQDAIPCSPFLLQKFECGRRSCDTHKPQRLCWGIWEAFCCSTWLIWRGRGLTVQPNQDLVSVGGRQSCFGPSRYAIR